MSTTSFEDKKTLYQTDSYTETGITFPGYEESYTESDLPITTYTNTKTSLEGTPDSKEALYSIQKNSLKDTYDSINEITPFLNTPQTSTKDHNLEYVIDRLAGGKKTPKETLY